VATSRCARRSLSLRVASGGDLVIMRAWVTAAVVAAVGAAILAVGLGGRASEGPAGEPASFAATPFPRPTPDPAAGKPAYLASIDAWFVLLDASGRVARVGLAREAGATLCPGGRRLVVAESWGGQVEVFSIGLRRLRAQRVPVGQVHGVACLDPRARRTAVVTESDTTAVRTLRVLAPGRRRVVLRSRGEVPLLDASGIYIADAAGVRQRALSDGRVLARLPQPAAVYAVMPSPDGRRWLMNVLPDDTVDRVYLGEPQSGDVRALPFAGEQALGWTGPEQFAVIGDGLVRILETGLATLRVVDPFPPRSALLAGDRIVAMDGTSLIAVPPGASAPESIGKVPERTYLLAALTPAG
jgi:hypothetical protein